MITIGLPTVNSELRISAQLDSLLHQTHGDFKILISDNASTDGTYDICQEYCNKDSRVVVIRQPERLNMRDNFKFLLDKAETAYFTWQADDDILDIKWLEVTHGELESRPDMNMAFTDSTLEQDGVDKIGQGAMTSRKIHCQDFGNCFSIGVIYGSLASGSTDFGGQSI